MENSVRMLKKGKSYAFNGTSSFVELPAFKEANLDHSFTIALWLKPQGINRFQRFMAMPRDDNFQCAWQFGFGPLASFQWGISTYNDGYQDYWVNDAIQENEWVHFTAVVDQT